MKKGATHLSESDRAYIEAGLRMGKSIKQLGKELNRSATTISREIAKHRERSIKGLYGRGNQCVHRQTCQIQGLCSEAKDCTRKCAQCKYIRCNQTCSKFETIDCTKRHFRTGHLCNGCPDEKSCHLIKYYYIANVAQKGYKTTLSECRKGADIDREELERLDLIISPRIKNGQSLHHIVVTHASEITRNERTLSRHLHNGLFSAKRGDMKRSCMVKPRKPKGKEFEHKVETGCCVGRTYNDYKQFLQENPDTSYVYMDLVIGRIGGVCLLTIHFVDSSFMIGRLIPNKCAKSVVDAIDCLHKELGLDLFKQLFPVLLTDRGGEFSNPTRIEADENKVPRTKVFYCDPMNSNQKSQIERNHEILREILPKGTSFDNLSQKDIDLALSHVNAYVRVVQSDKTPYAVFEFIHGEGIAKKLHISNTDPTSVCLKPKLLGITIG